MYQLLCANYLEKTSNIDYKKNMSNDMSVFGVIIRSSFVEVLFLLIWKIPYASCQKNTNGFDNSHM
jgi:hypothetical protein